MTDSAADNGPAGHPPGRGASEPAAAPLSGRVVLLPRVKEHDRIASALESTGAQVLRAAVTRTVPGDASALEATARRIAAGKAAWLVLTSARTVEALAPYLLAPVPSSVRVAVVGPATARAWTELTGDSPDLVARGSAAALLEEPVLVDDPGTPRDADRGADPAGTPRDATASPQSPQSPRSPRSPRTPAGSVPAVPTTDPGPARRVLLPASALADPTLADGLRRAGWEVEQVAAYTTVTADARDLPEGLDHTWGAGGVDVVVLTAPSTTRAVLELLGTPPPETRLVAIGATTAAAAGDLGLPVAATASSPTPEGVLRAAIDTVQTPANPEHLSQEPPR
ncbi:uroporphyrinogen-III synthase [Actinomyces sp. ZJ308]|uniref:uroporphyrinogen-III synthase n=1 Tax=Actinomyces sp. ZJ308 TaxID=2708342 RepID=UPI001422887E|nr:uroporphyrinogen-III synthase [Actinomyces sp. ZJ308]